MRYTGQRGLNPEQQRLCRIRNKYRMRYQGDKLRKKITDLQQRLEICRELRAEELNFPCSECGATETHFVQVMRTVCGKGGCPKGGDL